MSDNWRRLGSLVAQRRAHLGWSSREKFADRWGFSGRTLGKIERGEPSNYLASTIAQLERGLGWAPGSIDAVLAGGDPIDAEPATPTYDWQRLANHVRLRREEAGLSQAEAATRGSLSEDTLARIEAGERVRHQSVLFALDQAMAWFQGSAQRVLAGGDPHPQPGPPPRALSRYEALARAQRSSRPRPARRLTDLTYEDLFDRWARLFAQSLGIELEYAQRRGLSGPGEARDELYEVLVMADQGREGRPWAPPWEEPEELSDEEALDQIEALREAGLIDEHGEPIEDDDDDDGEPPHPIPEPEFEPGEAEHDVRIRDEGGSGREFRFSAPAVDRPLVAEVEMKDATRPEEAENPEQPARTLGPGDVCGLGGLVGVSGVGRALARTRERPWSVA